MRTRTRARTDLIPYHSLRSVVGRLLVLGIVSIAWSMPTLAGAVPIRVLLLQNLPTFSFPVPPNYTILTQPAGLLPAEANHWRMFQAQAGSRNIRLLEHGIQLDELRLAPRTKDAVIHAGSQLYRGSLEVKWRAGGLIVVNTLDIEEYLYGVVPKETPTQWEMAALRAQAIVARTYALYKRMRQANRDYDVAAQYIRDQHYEGYGAEHARTTQAVDDTQGLVLTCRGELIPAYYHAESAGYTENSEHVWSAPHPCLRAVKAQMHPASPYLQWSASLPLQDMRAALVKQGYAVGAIRRLEPIERSETGRIMRLKISHKRGETIIRGTDFRLALGPEVIRSTRFTVQLRDGRAFFHGQGWGHGVGLCQWCSQGMAELGYDHEAILTHYYQGAKLIRYQ
jgi:stage II sporulation protein D (peptidoglycan lytic transglycosylase)